MNQLEKLTQALNSLPGLGPRQAKRLALYLITERQDIGQNLIKSLEEARDDVHYCQKCQGIFFDKADTCRICRDPDRDRSVLMLVENDLDKDSVEKTSVYRGLYFILGGSVPLTESDLKNTNLRQEQLKKRLEADSEKLQEVILGFSYTPQGEHTARVITKYLADFTNRIKITTLGRGLSVGTELEYSDADTFKHAFSNRS